MVALCLILIMAATAAAYTIVMRDGRRVAIPSTFIVTPGSVTYEVSPGIQITLQMAVIDIGATERANNEPAGSLLKRVGVQRPSLTEKKQGAARGPAGRLLTNRNLEPYVKTRRESERAYEKRRIELGLPTVEESRQKAALEGEVILGELEQRRAEDKRSEDYWRARASALRTEIAATDAELNYIHARLDEIPFASATGSFTVVSSIFPFVSIGRSVISPSLVPRVPAQPGVFVAPVPGPRLSARLGLGGGMTRGEVFVNPGTLVHPGSLAVVTPFLAFPNTTIFSSPFQPYDFTYERSILITRFNELAGIKAGLNARWRELENEARRAGAPPGWLRP
jgi:hypothetical protein